MRFLLAILISVALHAVLAFALMLYFTHVSAPDELPQLDLTSVDLSFAEKADDTAEASPAPASPAPAAPVPPAPRETPKPPDIEAPPTAEPPPLVPAKSPLEDPVVPAERMDTPELPKPPESPAQAASVPQAPRQARVDAPPRPKRNIRPDYPRESRQRGEQGDVTLELDVAADGTVSSVRIVKSPGFPLLEEAAVKAARAARFTPAKSEGKPVASSARLTLTFKLR